MIIALLVIQLLKDSMLRIDAENKLPYPDYGGPDFINTSLEYSIGELHKLVVENGGTFSMNLSKAVTHAIASQKKGIKYQAAANTGDVIHDSWFLECIAKKALLPLAPKYYLHMSKATKEKMKDDIDEFGDFYFVDVDVSDMKQLFENMDVNKQAPNMEEVKQYREKYCPTPTWCHFSSCNIYFHHPLHSM
jgi:DNA ligase-4